MRRGFILERKQWSMCHSTILAEKPEGLESI